VNSTLGEILVEILVLAELLTQIFADVCILLLDLGFESSSFFQSRVLLNLQSREVLLRGDGLDGGTRGREVQSRIRVASTVLHIADVLLKMMEFNAGCALPECGRCCQ
jgi:fructose-specific phosphotransferase system component IIB